MKVIVFVVIVLVIVGFLVVDGVNMYGAHRSAVNVSNRAAEEAAQTYVDSGGSQEAAKRTVETLAQVEGVEVVSVSYHKGTTRWYEVTIRALGSSYFLKHLPLVKDHLAQESTAVVHFD
jgi:hypothetical protein